MAGINRYLLLFSAIILGASAVLPAQTGQSNPSSHVKATPATLDLDEAPAVPTKKVPAPSLLPYNSMFSIDPKTGGSHSIQVLSEDEMSREDRDLLANAQSSIQERAGVQNLEFEGAGWTYQELVCSALPNHMFLRFTRDNGTRQMSMFSAAIPRNGNGRVHIIPIVRKGYSLFSPAPIGALTMAAFSRIRTEEGAGASADWIGTGLCYAALAGANPKIGSLTIGDGAETPADFPPSLTITVDGGAVIRFADMAATPPMEWTMFFDPKGKLTKANHSPAYIVRVHESKPKADDAGPAKP